VNDTRHHIILEPVLGGPSATVRLSITKSLLLKDFIPFLSIYAHSFIATYTFFFTLVTCVISVLMVLPNFWNPLLSLNPFWRAVLALVLECYDQWPSATV
jgi:hypothetical protein